MGKFTCPQCHAEVTKEKGDDPGCPCCGYGIQSVAPYVPIQSYPIWKWTGPWENPNDTIWPQITWTSDTTWMGPDTKSTLS